jgi:hypothetical protein
LDARQHVAGKTPSKRIKTGLPHGVIRWVAIMSGCNLLWRHISSSSSVGRWERSKKIGSRAEDVRSDMATALHLADAPRFLGHGA